MLDKLRAMRKKTNLTQAEMASKLGISKQFYSQLERGERRLSYEMALAIANIFNTTPDKIFLPNRYTKSGHQEAAFLSTGTE